MGAQKTAAVPAKLALPRATSWKPVLSILVAYLYVGPLTLHDAGAASSPPENAREMSKEIALAARS